MIKETITVMKIIKENLDKFERQFNEINKKYEQNNEFFISKLQDKSYSSNIKSDITENDQFSLRVLNTISFSNEKQSINNNNNRKESIECYKDTIEQEQSNIKLDETQTDKLVNESEDELIGKSEDQQAGYSEVDSFNRKIDKNNDIMKEIITDLKKKTDNVIINKNKINKQSSNDIINKKQNKIKNDKTKDIKKEETKQKTNEKTNYNQSNKQNESNTSNTQTIKDQIDAYFDIDINDKDENFNYDGVLETYKKSNKIKQTKDLIDIQQDYKFDNEEENKIDFNVNFKRTQIESRIQQNSNQQTKDLDSYKTKQNVIIDGKRTSSAQFNQRIRNSIIEDRKDLQLKNIEQELNSKPVPAILVNSKMTIKFMNQESCKMFLIPDKSEVYNQSFLSLLHPMDHRKLYDLKTNLEVLSHHANPHHQVEIENRNENKFELKIQDSNMKICDQEVNYQFRILNTTKQEKVYLIFQAQALEEYPEKQQMINPFGPFNIAWSIYMFALILLILIYTPYIAVFGQGETNIAFEAISLTTFIVDIFLNFNLAIENPSRPGELILDRFEVSKQYLQGWFLIDLLATVPLDLILQESLNQSAILKNIKSVRMIKVVRLLKMLRITKAFTFMNMSSFWSTDLGREIMNFWKLHRGLYQLLYILLLLIFITHFFTIAFQALEDLLYFQEIYSAQANSKVRMPISWLEYYIHQEQSSHFQHPDTLDKIDGFSIYMALFLEQIKTSLGYSTIPVFSNWEAIAQILWMFIGLSFYGQMIGEVSSYLNHTNKDDIEVSDTLEQVNEICQQNKIDMHIQNKVIKEIEKNTQEKQWNVSCLKRYISKNVQAQLEQELYKDFIAQFNLFSKFNMKTIRALKHNAQVDDNIQVLRKDCPIHEIFFITSGVLQIQDENFNLQSEQQPQEIFAMKQFQMQFKKKQNIDLEGFLSKTKGKIERRIIDGFKLSNNSPATTEIQDEINSFIKEAMNKYHEVNSNSKTNTNNKNQNANYKTTIVDLNHNDRKGSEYEKPNEGNFVIRFSKTVIGTHGIKQVRLKQNELENIVFDDINTFYKMQDQTTSVEQVHQSELECARISQLQFYEHNKPGAKVRPDGVVIEVNQALKVWLSNTNISQKFEDIRFSRSSLNQSENSLQIGQERDNNDEFDKSCENESVVKSDSPIILGLNMLDMTLEKNLNDMDQMYSGKRIIKLGDKELTCQMEKQLTLRTEAIQKYQVTDDWYFKRSSMIHIWQVYFE